MKLDELLVINIPEVQAYLRPTHGPVKERFFHTHNCVRHLYVGTQAFERDIAADLAGTASWNPENEDSRHITHIYRGSKAYEFMLRFLCGLESAKLGEEHLVDPIRPNLELYTRKRSAIPSVPKHLESLLHDQKLVRETALHDFHPLSTFSEVGKRAAHAKKGDTALVIAPDIQAAKEMVYALGKTNSTQAGKIIVATFDDRVAALKEQLGELVALKHLARDYQCVTTSEAVGHLAEVDHVFVTLNPIAHGREKFLLQHLHNAKQLTALSHHGDKHITAERYRPWNELQHPNYINPMKVEECSHDQRAINQKAIEKASKACKLITDARARGITGGRIETLVKNHLDADPQELEGIMTDMLENQRHSMALATSRAQPAGLSPTL